MLRDSQPRRQKQSQSRLEQLLKTTKTISETASLAASRRTSVQTESQAVQALEQAPRLRRDGPAGLHVPEAASRVSANRRAATRS